MSTFGGIGEAALGTGLLLAPEPTGLTKIGGGALFLHGADLTAAGLKQFWISQSIETFTSQIIFEGLITTGVPSPYANLVGGLTEIGLAAIPIGIVGKVGVVAQSARALSNATGGIIVLGFGGSRWTSDIAISYYKTIIAAGLKLFALNILMGTAVELVNKIFSEPVTKIGHAYLALATLTIIAMLVDKIPAMIGGLVSHIGSESHTFGGGMMSVSGSVIGLGAQGITAFASGGTSAVATAATRVAQGAAQVSNTLKNLSK